MGPPELPPSLEGVGCWMVSRTPLTDVHTFAIAELALLLVEEAADLRGRGCFCHHTVRPLLLIPLLSFTVWIIVVAVLRLVG